MATLSLSFPGALLIDQAIGRLRRGRTGVRRFTDPQPIRVPGVADEIVVKAASEPDEWEQAFRLVAANYQEAGYEAQTGKPLRFTPYHALPDTAVFVAKRQGRVVATVSLVADNTLLGLPLEALYAAEIAGLRRQGRRVAEITSLAFTDLGQRAFLQVFFTLIRLQQQYHVSRGGDTGVIAVNPRHSNFYCKVLGAEQLGSRKPYAAVGDAPAEAFWMDQEKMRANAPRGYEQIFGEALPADALVAPPLPRPFVRYFASQSTQTDEAQLDSVLHSVAAFGSPRAW